MRACWRTLAAPHGNARVQESFQKRAQASVHAECDGPDAEGAKSMSAGRKPDRERDEGSGTILGVAIIAATMCTTGLVVSAFAVLALQQSVHGAADAAALAAADTASGAIAGFPCEAAAQAATINGTSVSSCAIDGLIAEISVERAAGPFVLRSRSRAGPPVTGAGG